MAWALLVLHLPSRLLPLPPPPHNKPHLDAGGPPVDEVGGLALAYALQALMHLAGVHLALDDVEDGDVARRGQVLGARMGRHLVTTPGDTSEVKGVG